MKQSKILFQDSKVKIEGIPNGMSLFTLPTGQFICDRKLHLVAIKQNGCEWDIDNQCLDEIINL